MRSLGSVTAGTLLANLLAYLVQVPASRVLGPEGFSEFSVLNAAMLVASVPALALQAVVAREVVGGTAHGRLWRLIGAVGVAVAAGSAVAVVAMMAIAHTALAPTAAALAGAAPLAVIAGGQGFLQGTGRFGTLGGLLACVGVLRSVPVVVAVYAGAGPTGALASGTVGTVVAAVLVGVLAAGGGGDAAAGGGGDEAAGGGGDAAAGGGGEVARPRVALGDVLAASAVQFVMIVAVSVDLLLSRSVLGDVDAGVYALGAVATKAAFWLPQAIGVVVYPRLADPLRSTAALRRAVLVLTGIGLVVTVGAAIGGPLVPAVISDDYRPVAGLMWLFALTGGLLAVLQVMLLAAIARNAARGALPAFVVLLAEVAVILAVADSVTTLAVAAAAAAACAVLATRMWLAAGE